MSHIQELDSKELKDVNGGNPIIIGIGVIAGGAAIIDYGMDAYKG
ncbi:class IIb bacteriocin, lactobin A/cerein 7B family, partial [Bacillus thuringiensis]